GGCSPAKSEVLQGEREVYSARASGKNEVYSRASYGSPTEKRGLSRLRGLLAGQKRGPPGRKRGSFSSSLRKKRGLFPSLLWEPDWKTRFITVRGCSPAKGEVLQESARATPSKARFTPGGLLKIPLSDPE